MPQRNLLGKLRNAPVTCASKSEFDSNPCLRVNPGPNFGRASLLSIVSHKTLQSPNHCSGTGLQFGTGDTRALPPAEASDRFVLRQARIDGGVETISALFVHSALVNWHELANSAAPASM